MMEKKEMNEFIENMIFFTKSDECNFPEFSYIFENSIIEIKNMFENEKGIITESIKDSLNIIEELYMEYKLNQNNIDFLLKYLLLLHNANINFIQNDELDKKISFYDRCLTNLITSVDAISIMRMMIFKMKQYSKYGMPSIELSKLYVESME